MMQQGPYNTLLITPDQVWSLLIHEHLAQNGFAPFTLASTSECALTLFHRIVPHLVLIDLDLPDCDVIELCNAMLLAQPTVKMILITESDMEAPPTALSPRISGCIGRSLPLNVWSGLLTYIVNGGMAFSQNMVKTVLVEARVMQRYQPSLIIGALQVDLIQRLVMYAGVRVLLTPREFALLAYLAGNADSVVTVDQLLNEAWGYDSDHGTAAQVRLYITRLRRKLLTTAQTPDFICTVRGVGYRLHSAALR